MEISDSEGDLGFAKDFSFFSFSSGLVNSCIGRDTKHRNIGRLPLGSEVSSNFSEFGGTKLAKS